MQGVRKSVIIAHPTGRIRTCKLGDSGVLFPIAQQAWLAVAVVSKPLVGLRPRFTYRTLASAAATTRPMGGAKAGGTAPTGSKRGIRTVPFLRPVCCTHPSQNLITGGGWTVWEIIFHLCFLSVSYRHSPKLVKGGKQGQEIIRNAWKI